jgi:uncharacterized protein
MRCVDVNVLVYAHRPESPKHHEWRGWLDDARRGPEQLGLISAVATGFLRIVTHPRVFDQPTPIDIALEFVDALRAAPTVADILPGPRHWQIVSELCRVTGATGNRVPDAALAAIALEQGATFVTADHGFARYDGLRIDIPV